MNQRLLHASLILMLIGGLGARAFALEGEKWSRIRNASPKDYTLAITDWKLVLGNLHIKKASEAGDGLKLSTAKASMVLNANTDYLCYFEPTGHSFALTFTVSSGDNVTEFNLKRAPGLGDRLVVLPRKSLTDAPVSINLSGFRRLNAGPFLEIH